jgi:hypothetical protein
MTDAETLIGSNGAERVRWAAVDFGPVNTALALVEVRGLPPSYDPEKVRMQIHKAARGYASAAEQLPPWVTVLAAVKFDLASNALFTYFDPDFQKEFEGLIPATATRAKFVVPFDARTPCPGSTIDLTSPPPEEKKTKTKSKKPPKEPQSAMYPRVDAIRGMDHGTSRGYFETCSLNLGKFFAHKRMQWFFARKWPVVFENQLDHLARDDDDGGGGGGGKRRPPYNWAEAMGTISVVSAIDAIYDRDDPNPQPRIMMYVASKYGLDEVIKKLHPTYDTLFRDKQRRILKSESINVLRSLPLRTSFWNWFDTLRDKRGPKQDDVADVVNMAIGAVERYYRGRRLSPAEQDEHRSILNKAVRINTSGAKTLGRAVPDCIMTGKAPEIPPAPRPIAVPQRQSTLSFGSAPSSGIIKTALKKIRNAKRARPEDTGPNTAVVDDVIVDDDDDDDEVKLLAPVLKRTKPMPSTLSFVIPRGKGSVAPAAAGSGILRRPTGKKAASVTAAVSTGLGVSSGVIRPGGSVTLYDIEDGIGVGEGGEDDFLGLEFGAAPREHAAVSPAVKRVPDARPSTSLYRPRDRSDHRISADAAPSRTRPTSAAPSYDAGDAPAVILDAAVRGAY